MEIASFIFLNPITIAVIVFIILLACILSPYDIQFEDKEESDN